MSIRIIVILVLFGLGVVGVAAQEKAIKIDKDGDFHIDSRTVVGDRTLERGMYRVLLTKVNGRDILVVYSIPMRHFSKAMWPAARTELFRIEVTPEPGIAVTKSILTVLKSKKVQLGLDLSFKGDPTRYVLPHATTVEK